MLGMMEGLLGLCPEKGRINKWLALMGWRWKRVVVFLSPPIDCSSHFVFINNMNIIVWNCRGALKPNFQSHVRELVRNHNPAILVVMETRVGGDRAKEITNRLPFDGAILADTVGFAGGIWLLWNSDKVEVVHLASTEQEIHVEVKVLPSNLSWIFTAVYASPRIVERQVWWENLSKIADLRGNLG